MKGLTVCKVFPVRLSVVVLKDKRKKEYEHIRLYSVAFPRAAACALPIRRRLPLLDLARRATAHTLKFLYQRQPDRLFDGLRRGMLSDLRANVIDNTLSDSADLVNSCYIAMYDARREGSRFVDAMRLGCAAVRRAVYSMRSARGRKDNYRVCYLDDVSGGDLVRVDKYYDFDNLADLEAARGLIEKLNLTHRQNVILNYKLRGMTGGQIAAKLKVTRNTVFRSLQSIRAAAILAAAEFDSDDLKVRRNLAKKHAASMLEIATAASAEAKRAAEAAASAAKYAERAEAKRAAEAAEAAAYAAERAARLANIDRLAAAFGSYK
jgi:DNA-binding CsgD family transcriptional regulator